MQSIRSLFRSTPRRAAAVIVLAAGAAAVLPTLSAVAAAPAKTVTVDIAKFTYGPKDLTITPGTKVVWTNKDETPHTVTSNDKTFASKGLDTDDKYEHTFAAPGDFDYICTVHPFMTGTVHVH